ncbi:AIPR family protein [Sphingomonas sp. LY54]|uniref:AIPR family protein n=1 Tax=Sphingomonas sp. LY54 TaxID=3095343 RepID=UPI002D77BED9|nr:AIPR family protein [Sphingomonas sp. LY54]WRP29773.1 AIPR family protein [Sphingomonas sp. LY54]
MDELIEFHREWLAEVQGDADAQGLITTEAFLEKMGEILAEAGELSSFAQCYHEGIFKKKPLQIDAYGWDPEDEEGTLSVVISDFHRGAGPESIGGPEVKKLLSRLVQFIMAANDREYRENLEESGQAFVLADLIKRSWKRFSKIKLILVTNRINKSRTDANPVGRIGDVPVTTNVWDLGRIQRFIEAGQTREDLVIDFAEDFGEPVPVLKASFDGAPFESYIAVIPGSQLAAIYDKWGARLLEANVRSFLQARGNVNRGMRDTIKDDPSMFFSYNNGLTTTAESVEVADMGEGLLLMSASNFQIVNGGQTTASIHAARKLAAEKLKDVYVQMKLTVVPPERSELVVPNISQFANSQNKVNAADFFANHPFHIKMEEFSRRMLAPIGDSNYREHKWFYERARGQFADERGRRSAAERKNFDAMFPKAQFFTKTDLAKFENSYRCKPHIVSYGAQKNFAELAKVIGEEWGRSEGAHFDEVWFQRLIAKAIIFRNLERVVPAQPWYTGGYRANIVTYAIAKVVHDAHQRGRLIDLDNTWKMQRVHVELERALLAAAEAANSVITNPPAGVRNMSEWAKKQACWAALAKCPVEYAPGFQAVLVDPESVRAIDREKRSVRRQISSIEAQREVVNQGGEYWAQLLAFGRSIGKLGPREAGILQACSLLPNRVPSEKQCVAAVAIADKLEQFYDRVN